MWSARLLMAAAIVAAAGTSAVAQEERRVVPLVRLKPADTEMRRLISDGFDRSATFRALVEEIHRSNAIAVVQFGLCANGRFRSCVTNIDGDLNRRSIRVKVNTRTTDDRLIATIAHELHHVIEILSDPEVANPESVLALYRRIGTGPCRQGLSEACETDAALRVEAVVSEELTRRTRQ